MNSMRWGQTNNVQGLPQEADYDYAELILDELRKDEELFTSRLNLFLVAESLLFLSYATFMNIGGIDEKIMGLTGVLAILITFIYLVVINRTVIYINELKRRLMKIYPNYDTFRTDRICAGNVNNCLRCLPLIFFVAWIILFIFNLNC